MSLIKCKECLKDISDKATSCIHCGCPIEQEIICEECGNLINKTNNVCENCGCPAEFIQEKIIVKEESLTKMETTIFNKIWLIICIVLCFLISILSSSNPLNLYYSDVKINIGVLEFSIMGMLSFLLGGTYIALLKNISKKNFIVLLCINALIFIYNIFSSITPVNLFYIICVILNVLVSFFVLKRDLNNTNFNVKDYIPFTIILIFVLILIIIFPKRTELDITQPSLLGTYVQDGGVGTTIILLDNNICSMSVADQSSEYPATISKCNWDISNNIVTINFTMSMSNAFGQVYTRDNTLVGTYSADSIIMEQGAVYYKR